MICPRCDTGVLIEKPRMGVTIDACLGCRGIWLDRGELEKLLALAARDADASDDDNDSRPTRLRERERVAANDDRRWERDTMRYPHTKKKTRWYEVLGDLFD